MENPWLHIPLDDYEGHMAHTDVAQDILLADVLELAVRRHAPSSLAVIGCAGGNGFDRLAAFSLERVVAVDINPIYVQNVRKRYEAMLPGLQLIAGDIQDDGVSFTSVDLIIAGLLFEYVDSDRTLTRLHALLRPGGVLVSVIQLPCEQTAVTHTPYTSLNRLEGYMRLISPEQPTEKAVKCGFKEITSSLLRSAAGKPFQLLEYQRTAK